MPANKKPHAGTKMGFTLIELLVVLAIIGILASVITLAINSARTKGRDSKRVGDMRQIANAMEQYYTQHGSYPTGTGSSVAGGTAFDNPAALDGAVEPFVPNYAPIIPTSPLPTDGSCVQTGLGGNNYWYETELDGLTYTLTFCLGGDNGEWRAGIRSITPNGFQ
jgi:prepilin-type N-terminal cleavage/methylation domain-containing protein